VSPLLAGVALLMLASALQFSLLAVRGEAEGFSEWVTASMATCYFLGFLVGGWLAPRMIDSVGHVRVFSALASLASVVILVQAFAVDPPAWLVARIASGFCIAGMVTSVEAWLNAASDTSNRGTTLALYMVVMYLGFGGGQVLIGLGDAEGFGLFALVSVLLSLCLVPVLLGAREGQVIHLRAGISTRELMRRAPVGLAASLSGGLAWGVIASMLIVVGLREGYGSGQSASIVLAAVVGAVLSQPPIGRLSDRLDRRKVVLATALATAAAGVTGMPLITSGRLWLVWLLAALLGALALPGYSLGIAHVGDVLTPQESVSAAGTLVTVSAVGSAAGPPLAGAAIGVLGSPGVPALFAGFGTLLAAFSWWHLFAVSRVRPRGQFVALAARATPMGSSVAAEEIVGLEEPLTTDEAESSQPSPS
jgi:MFS family permease